MDAAYLIQRVKEIDLELEQLNPTTGVNTKATRGSENRESRSSADSGQDRPQEHQAEGAAVDDDSREEEDGLSPGVAMEDMEEKEEVEEEGEEGREAVAMPSPMTPSRKEREQHELTHTPYRSWCPHCVRARGRNRAHRANKEPEKPGVPIISFDYFVFSDEDEKSK